MSYIAVVYGTRPEAIKLAPVVEQLRRHDVPTRVVCTGQHTTLLKAHALTPDTDLGLMAPGETPADFVARALVSLSNIWRHPLRRPSRVVVQGDTATAFAAALAAFHLQVPVAHVEAGLRSFDLTAPFPEEGYRAMISRIADRHYAPTSRAAGNLLHEGLPTHNVFVTGNTGIDAAMAAAARGGNSAAGQSGKPYVLVTLHRREAFGEPMRQVCVAIKKLAGEQLDFIVTLHPNPEARAVIEKELSGAPSVTLIMPLAYDDLIATMRGAWAVLTDSGGIQEEAPAFGVPVFVAREVTERPEGVEAGAAKLVGYSAEAIAGAVRDLYADPVMHGQMARVRHVYGDGRAAERIAKDLRDERSARGV